MPELPDVEGERRTFARVASGRTVASVTGDATIVRNTSLQGLGRALKGRRFGKPDRHGKWLLCPAGPNQVLFHFGMTGSLVDGAGAPPHHHDRLVVRFEGGGELRYRAMRKLGGVWLAHDGRARARILGDLGPDAMALSEEELDAMVGARRGGSKAALMDQGFIAGLGNLSCDEVLWRAGISPRRPLSSLSRDDVAGLHRAMLRVLRDSARVGRIPGRPSWLTGHRSPGESCPACGTRLERARVAGRTTYWCPGCQP